MCGKRSLPWLVMVLLGACAPLEGGSASITFAWPDGPPADVAALYAHVRVEDRTDPQGPAVLRAAPPASLDGGAEFDLFPLPHGDARVVVVEVRTGATTASPVRFYGSSEPFSLAPGLDAEVAVEVPLTPVPGAPDDAGDLTAFAAIEAVRVGTAVVTVLAAAARATEIELSNDPSFPDDARTGRQALNSLAVADKPQEWWIDEPAYRVPWDLEAGLEAWERCEADQEYCDRRVYARFYDAQGYVSPTLATSTRLDRRPPAEVLEATYAVPDILGPGSDLFLNLSFDGPLAAPPQISLVAVASDGETEVEGGARLDLQPLADEGPSSNFAVVLPAADLQAPPPLGEPEYDLYRLLTAGDGYYAVLVRAEDQAGNVAPALSMTGALLYVDTTPPHIALADGHAVPAAINKDSAPDLRVRLRVTDEGPPPDPQADPAFASGLEVTLWIDNYAVDCMQTDFVNDPQLWSCDETVAADQGEGWLSVSVVVTDQAYNSSVMDLQTVLIDRSQPELLYWDVYPSSAAPGDTVTILAGFDEPVFGGQGAPAPTLTPEPALPAGSPAPALIGYDPTAPATHVSWSWQVPTGATPATYALVVTAWDEAANEVATTLCTNAPTECSVALTIVAGP
jgi:hypothetical protein